MDKRVPWCEIPRRGEISSQSEKQRVIDLE
jgi:hypothetical protein